MDKVSVGLLTVFNHETHEWELYKGRIEQWFLANEIDDDVDKSGAKRRAILLSSFAENTYKLIRDLALPNEVSSLSYVQVVCLLDGHFKAKKCGFAERYKFHCAFQGNGESLSEWAARVRGLAKDCSFPAVILNEMLRDRFVLGMVNGKVRERLFEKSLEGLTMEKALQLAESVYCASEGARQAATAVQRAPAQDLALSPFVEMHKVSTQQGSPQGRQVNSANKGSSSRSVSASKNKCIVCNFSGHDSQICRFKSYTCRLCGVKGHIQRACVAKRGRDNQHFLQYRSDDQVDGDDGKRLIFNLRSYRGEPMRETIVVDSITLCFELDTGSAVTAISDSTYYKYFFKHNLLQNNRILQSYNGSTIKTIGMLPLNFKYRNKTETIDVYVVKGGGPPLLGRDFIHKFNLEICPVNVCTTKEGYVETLISNYPKLFSDSLGCCKDIEVTLNLKPDSKPIFFKARSVPFALRSKLETELNRLTSLGVIEPVQFSEYASPIVPVLKSNGDIRLCADYSVSLNKQLLIEKYPLPRIEELFSKLHGGLKFSKLDLSNAYNQLKLKEESQLLTCINTHKGLFKYTRLVFGLSSAPAIFQRTLEIILTGIDGVLQFLDDILITGKTEQEHLDRLNQVFKRLENAGLVLQKDKCNFFQESVSYLGYTIDKNGLHKSPDKVKAILKANIPTNVTELKSFLGLVNYYRGFIKNASSILCPLHSLLKKNITWKWEREHSEAFELIKKQLASDNILAHFNPESKIILTVDASPYGLGAVLSQIEGSGEERPVSYVSRSLSSAEKKYSQIQKEATAIIFGVRRFHQYLYGRAEPFILRTDHKPLLSIFQPGRGIPEITANRLQRYALFLGAYNYNIEYVSSANNSADYLSRSTDSGEVPSDLGIKYTNACKQVGSESNTVDNSSYLYYIWDANSMPAIFKDVEKCTKSDKILSQVIYFVLNGWPKKVRDKELKPYFNCRYELSVEQGCVMRGAKLVIPDAVQSAVVKELHTGHLGVAKMKATARMRFWWPRMSERLETTVSTCSVCAQLRPTPPRAPLTPWPYPPEPWYRVHVDFLGPFNNKVYLIVVDAYSKWVEVYDVSYGYSSRVVIEKLSEIMSRFGLFNTICSDNGSSFTSSEFKNFCSSNGISHLTSPTYHPASNGQAESFVKIIKKALKGILLSGTSKKEINNKLNEFLFHYRNSVHSTTNRSPAEMLFGKNLRCRLDLLKPTKQPLSPPDHELTKIVKDNQCSQIRYYNGKRNIDFIEGEVVLVKTFYKQHNAWCKAIVLKKLGRSIYLVNLMDNNVQLKRHKNQICKFEGGSVAPAKQTIEASEEGYKVPSACTVLPPVVLKKYNPAGKLQPSNQVPAPSIHVGTETPTGSPRPPGESKDQATDLIPGPSLSSPPSARPTPEVTRTPRAQRPRKHCDYRRYF